MQENVKNRIFGLDIIRAFAIVEVVWVHSKFLLKNNFHPFKYTIFPSGVDLFFVLSGYLIGTIIIKTVEQNNKFSIKVVGNFLKRRWFRTLPNYFLFLLINIVLIYFGLIDGYLNKYLVTFFLFLQNFVKPYDFLFWESWSLAVEEWFYLLFPLLLFILIKIKGLWSDSKKAILLTILVFITFPLIYRISQSGKFLDWDLYFRKIVLARFDTIGFGLLAAYIHWYHAEFWKKYSNTLFVIGLASIVILINFEYNLFCKQTFYFTLMALSISFLFPKLQSFKNENIPLKPVQFISKISFSMYLIHMPLLSIISKHIIYTTKVEVMFIYAMFWIITILLSTLVYKFYEKPIMNIRERITF